MNSSRKAKENQITSRAEKFHLFRNRKRPQFTSKQGVLYKESLNLLFQKIGITNEELRAINKKSLADSRSFASKCSQLSKKGSKNNVRLMDKVISGDQHAINSIIPYGGYAPPTGPITMTVSPPNAIVHGHAHAEGQGDGLRTSDYGGNDDQYGFFEPEFLFPNLRVPVTGFYLIEVALWMSGTYYVYADDGACNSKEAYCMATAGGQISQSYNNQLLYNFQFGKQLTETPYFLSPLDYEYAEGVTNEFTFYIGGQNIKDSGNFFLSPRLFINDVNPIWLSADFNIDVQIYPSLNVMAKGAGSVADLNCDVLNGGLTCLGLTMWLQ